MMTKLYTVLGFLAWQGIKLALKRKLAQKRATLLAAGTVILVALAGFAAARGSSTDDE
jgi:hypothetical protein